MSFGSSSFAAAIRWVKTLNYGNLVLLHLWPVAESYVKEALAVPGPASSDVVSPQDHGRRRQKFFQYNILCCCCWMSSCWLSYSLGALCLAIPLSIINVLGVFSIVISADGIMNGLIILYFLSCTSVSQRRWSMKDRKVLSKLLSEVMAGLVRTMIMALVCGVSTQAKFITPTLSNDLQAENTTSVVPPLRAWCVALFAILIVLVMIHVAYVIGVVGRLSRDACERETSGNTLEAQECIAIMCEDPGVLQHMQPDQVNNTDEVCSSSTDPPAPSSEA